MYNSICSYKFYCFLHFVCGLWKYRSSYSKHKCINCKKWEYGALLLLKSIKWMCTKFAFKKKDIPFTAVATWCSVVLLYITLFSVKCNKNNDVSGIFVTYYSLFLVSVRKMINQISHHELIMVFAFVYEFTIILITLTPTPHPPKKKEI